MEPDRYKNNHFLYIFGLICLILAVSLFFFSLYIIPFLIWHLSYNVPSVLIYMTTYMGDNYNLSPIASNFLAWLMFFIPSLVFGLISYFISNRIDNQIYHIDTTENDNEDEQQATSLETNKKIRESAGLGLKIILLMVVIFIIIFLLQLFVTSTT